LAKLDKKDLRKSPSPWITFSFTADDPRLLTIPSSQCASPIAATGVVGDIDRLVVDRRELLIYSSLHEDDMIVTSLLFRNGGKANDNDTPTRGNFEPIADDARKQLATHFWS
jgi:hypothetical protein